MRQVKSQIIEEIKQDSRFKHWILKVQIFILYLTSILYDRLFLFCIV